MCAQMHPSVSACLQHFGVLALYSSLEKHFFEGGKLDNTKLPR